MKNRFTLIKGIRSLIDEVADSLPVDNISGARDLLRHGEWGLAFELICTQLYEYEVLIAPEMYETIEQLGQKMKISPDEWKMLRELIKTP